MAWYDTLLEQGYVPSGVKPKVITEPGGTPGNYQTDRFSTALRALDTFQKQEQKKEEARKKEMQRQAEMYKTLREAGYEPKRAYEATMKGGKLPEPTDGDRIIPKTQREKILDKISRGETLSAGEQQVYDETIKKKQDESLDSILSPNQQKMKDNILDKMAKGQALTPGEQKIYDEVIKKSGSSDDYLVPGKALGEQIEPNDVNMRGKDMVPVIGPDGTRGWIPIKNLKRAIKAGYKTRKL